MTNSWSCLGVAFAIALDIKYEDLIRKVGHDGSEIIFPNSSDPFNRRAFHIQEMIDIATGLEYSVTEIVRYPLFANPDEDGVYSPKGEWDKRFNDYLSKTSRGVLAGYNKIGSRHAVAWNGKMIIDPALGCERTIQCIETEVLWMISNGRSRK